MDKPRDKSKDNRLAEALRANLRRRKVPKEPSIRKQAADEREKL
jgi:hypothetical protein